jgi:Kef-type K+ transport system membrane component KefB
MIRIILSLLLLVAVVFVTHLMNQGLGAAGDAALVRAAMHVGLLMIGAWLTGLLFARVHLPRVSGYLVFGILVGPHLWPMLVGPLGLADSIVADPLIEADQLPELGFASDLAIALIALTAGGELRFSWLRSQWRPVSVITGIELFGVWLIAGVAVFLALGFVPDLAEAPRSTRIVIAALVGLVAAANSPAIVIAMVTEFKATGTLARTALAVTILKDMLMVVLFAATLAIGKGVVDGQNAMSAAFFGAVSVQLLGSLALGAVVGAAMSWYVHRVEEHLAFVVVGTCILLAVVGKQAFVVGGQTIHFEPLLMGLAAGLVMVNAWPKQTEPLFESIEDLSLPVYCLFFAVAGAELALGRVLATWGVIAVLVVVRALAVLGTVDLAGRLAGLDPAVRRRLWLGFVPQAGVALALAALIRGAFAPAIATPVVSMVIGMVAVHALVGPIGFRYALIRSGEAGESRPPHERT